MVGGYSMNDRHFGGLLEKGKVIFITFARPPIRVRLPKAVHESGHAAHLRPNRSLRSSQ